jgi:hypothetical protein
MYVTWTYQKFASSLTDAGDCTPSINTTGCPERRLLAIVALKNPWVPVGPETVKFRRSLVESKRRLETEELLTTCICNPTVVALVMSVDTVVVEVTVLVSVTVAPPVVVVWLCAVVTVHVVHVGLR